MGDAELEQLREELERERRETERFKQRAQDNQRRVQELRRYSKFSTTNYVLFDCEVVSQLNLRFWRLVFDYLCKFLTAPISILVYREK